MFFGWKKLKKLDKEKEKAWRDDIANEKISFKDALAMLAAAFFTLILPAMLVLLGLSFLALWMFGAI